MSPKSLILIINLILVLVLLPTSAYSAPLTERDIEEDIERYFDSLIEDDLLIDLVAEQDLLIRHDMGSLCQNETSLSCCPLLAHRIAFQHNTRAASMVLVNKSGHNITLLDSSVKDGRWITSSGYDGIDVDCEPQPDPLPSGQSKAFSSTANYLLGKVQGSATFIINDDTLSTFTISWEVPNVGSPQYSVEGLPDEKYNIRIKLDHENTNFQVTVDQFSSFWTLPVIISSFLFLLCCCICFIIKGSFRVCSNRIAIANKGGEIKTENMGLNEKTDTSKQAYVRAYGTL